MADRSPISEVEAISKCLQAAVAILGSIGANFEKDNPFLPINAAVLDIMKQLADEAVLLKGELMPVLGTLPPVEVIVAPEQSRSSVVFDDAAMGPGVKKLTEAAERFEQSRKALEVLNAEVTADLPWLRAQIRSILLSDFKVLCALLIRDARAIHDAQDVRDAVETISDAADGLMDLGTWGVLPNLINRLRRRLSTAPPESIATTNEVTRFYRELSNRLTKTADTVIRLRQALANHSS
ncbi:hypothetical protein [Solimonas soli]|uniref:hypothetical protein n=1 Tax=Solimonas soli TaxID=413479 RepID=UPI0012F76396|nr:hypothetical protein [Solimonas soli]